MLRLEDILPNLPITKKRTPIPMGKRTLPRASSPGEEALALHLKAHKIPYQREVLFHPDRRWRFDFTLRQPSVYKVGIAAEVEGGIYSGGRHTRGNGFLADCRKYNEAALLNWVVLRFTTEMVNNGEAINCIKRAIA